MIAEERLARAFLVAYPSRAAMSLEQMPVARAAAVLRAVPATSAAGVLSDMTVSYAAECLAQLAAGEGAAIVGSLRADDAAGIVRAVASDRREPLLEALDPAVRDPIARALSYAEGTAGAVMDPAIFQLSDDVIVAAARVRLGRAARDLLYYLYVVDREHRLVGVLDIPELLLARARDPVSAVMHRHVDRVSAFLPVALVRAHAGWQQYHALPVVDEEDRLLGAIRYQTLRRLERDASDRGPDPAHLTAGALAELFQLGTTGLVTGVAGVASTSASASASASADPDRPVAADEEVPDEE